MNIPWAEAVWSSWGHTHVLQIILLANTVQLKIQKYVFTKTLNLKQACMCRSCVAVQSWLCSQMDLYMGTGEPQGVWCSWSGCGPTDPNPSIQDTPVPFPTASCVYTGSREAMTCVISSRTLPQTHIHAHTLSSATIIADWGRGECVCTAIMWREIELTHTTDGRLGNPYESDRPDQELHCQWKREGERERSSGRKYSWNEMSVSKQYLLKGIQVYLVE